MTSVLFRLTEQTLTLAAATTFRLAVRHLPVEQAHAASDLLIPAASLTELVRLLPEREQVAVFVHASASQVLFQTRSLALATRLIEGTFPAFERILPSDYVTRFVVERQVLASALACAVPLARESAQRVQLSITPDPAEGLAPGTLTIRTQAQDLGSTRTLLDVAVQGVAHTLSFNMSYLTQALDALDCTQVALETNGASLPSVLKVVNSTESVHLFMPMTSTAYGEEVAHV